MKYKDRSEILAQLQDAFGSDERPEARLTTEVVRIDNHNVARVTQIKDPTIEEQLYAKYPDALSVKEMIGILESNPESNIKSTGLKLHRMLTGAFSDEEAIQKLVKICRDYESKLYSTSDGVKKQLVLYCFVADLDKLQA